MSGTRTIHRPQVVNFFALDASEPSRDFPRPANDNCCPHCGGLMEPGDNASDCSMAMSSTSWPHAPFPKGWEASC